MGWDELREWLEGDGAAWTQWAQMGDIASDIADDVLERFGITATRSGRARLRREVDAAQFAPVAVRPWWTDDASDVEIAATREEI